MALYIFLRSSYLFGAAGDGVTMKQAALKLGRSYGAIKAEASRMGLNWMQGTITAKQVANLLGVDVRTIRHRRKKLNQRWRAHSKTTFIARSPTVEEIKNLAKHILEANDTGRMKASLSRLKRIANGDFDLLSMNNL